MKEELIYHIETLKKCSPVSVEGQCEDLKDFTLALNYAISLMETVLAIGGKMPEKQWCIGISSHAHREPSIECKECAYWEGRNDGIDQCVLAFAGMGLSVEEIEEMLRGECQVRWKEQGYNVVCGHPLPCPKHQKIETWRLETATEIHKAWEGKVRDETKPF